MLLRTLTLLNRNTISQTSRCLPMSLPTLQFGLDSSKFQTCFNSQNDYHCTSIIARYCHNDIKNPIQSFNLARDAVQKTAIHNGSKSCLIFTDGKQFRDQHTYEELFADVKNLATGLAKTSHGAPKLALVILPKIYPWWTINVAGAWNGMIVCPGTIQLQAKDIEYRLTVSGADAIFCTPEMMDSVDKIQIKLGKEKLLKVAVSDEPIEARPGWHSYMDLVKEGSEAETKATFQDMKPEDVCQIYFTSGTTGNPKIVPHTHTDYAKGHMVTARTWLDLNQDDVLWNVSDTGWAKSAWSSLYIPFLTGATAFIHTMEKFDPETLLEGLVKESVTVLCAPPTVYRLLIQMPLEKYSFKALRHCVSAGEPLNPEVSSIWKLKTGLSIFGGYGQTETTLVCCTTKDMKLKQGSCGKPTPGYDVRILDDNFKEVGPMTVGVISIRSNPKPLGLFKGYLNANETNDVVFQKGFYQTGDRGFFDNDGYLFFVARDDDVISSSAYRIGPFEVESSLLEHEAVVEAAVIGVPNEIRGENVKAFIHLTPKYAKLIENNEEAENALKIELQSHVKSSTAPYKYPREIEFVTSFPKTVSGKIQRYLLRQQDREKKQKNDMHISS